MARHQLAAVIGVSSALLALAEHLYGQGNVADPLEISRGNSRGFLVYVHRLNPNLSVSATVTWEYKLQTDQDWKNLTNVSIHRHIKTLYFLEGLMPDKLYYIRAFLSPPGKYTPIKESWTCPIEPPPVQEMRVVGAGPGWLDVRWTQPREHCDSLLTFLVRYRVDEEPFGPQRSFGVIEASEGYATYGPVHPCGAARRDEFCVLLTDRVQPGRRHTVEVRTRRYDWEDNAVSEPRSVAAWAVDQDSAPAAALAATTGPWSVVVPLWALALLAAAGGGALLLALACLCASFRKKRSVLSNSVYGPVTLEEMPSFLNLSISNIYDYPQLPQGKDNCVPCSLKP